MYSSKNKDNNSQRTETVWNKKNESDVEFLSYLLFIFNSKLKERILIHWMRFSDIIRIKTNSKLQKILNEVVTNTENTSLTLNTRNKIITLPNLPNNL